METATETNGTVGKARAKPKPPTLITLDGGRKITSSGRWNDGLLLGYLQTAENDYQAKIAGRFYPDKLGYGWVDIAEIAKVAYGQNSVDSKRKSRTALTRLFKYALGVGIIIVVNYDPTTRRTLAAKVFDPKSSDELRLLNAKVNRLLDTSELSSEQYEKIMGIINSVED
jgi:hypothetical protein